MNRSYITSAGKRLTTLAVLSSMFVLAACGAGLLTRMQQQMALLLIIIQVSP